MGLKTHFLFPSQTEIFGLNESARRKVILEDILQGLKSQVHLVVQYLCDEPKIPAKELYDLYAITRSSAELSGFTGLVCRSSRFKSCSDPYYFVFSFSVFVFFCLSFFFEVLRPASVKSINAAGEICSLFLMLLKRWKR